MRITSLLLAFAISISFLSSCNQDIVGDVTVTFQEGSALYADLDEIRSTRLLGEARPVDNPGKIFVSPDYLFIGEEGQGIHVVDNSNPEQPLNLAFINIPGNREYFFQNDMIYAESYYDVLKIDVSNPTQPLLVTRVLEGVADELVNGLGEALIGFSFERVTRKLDKNDNIYDYIWDSGNGSFVFRDFEEKLIPPSVVPASFAGNSNNQIGSVNRMVRHQEYVYLVGKTDLSVFDDRARFQKVAIASIGWEVQTIYPMDNWLFAGAMQDVSIVDISNPEVPVVVGAFQHGTSCDPVLPINRETAYVTLRTGDISACPGDVNALVVLDITDFSLITPVQEIEMQSPYGLTRIGNKLFVGEGENGLKIFDVTNERNLVLEEWDQSLAAYDVLSHPVRPDILLTAGPNGLSQYQLDDAKVLLSHLAF